MPNKNANKGKRFERTIVNKAKEFGLEAKRMYGSDGTSAGYCKEVDVVMSGRKQVTAQLKCGNTYRLPLFIDRDLINVDMMIVKEDNGKPRVIMTLETLFDLLK